MMRGRTNVAIITSRFPFSHKEAFLAEEIRELRRFVDVSIVVGAWDGSPCAFADCEPLVLARPRLTEPAVWLRAFMQALRRPRAAVTLLARLISSATGMRSKLANVAAWLLGLSVTAIVQERGIEQVHAYWLSLPASIAYVISTWNDIEWSATGHRYDLVNFNLSAADKPHRGFLRTAKFIRAISDRGRIRLQSVLRTVDVATVHLGVRKPDFVATPLPASSFRLVCIAAFVPVKGHLVLLRALKTALDQGIAACCDFIGDGPERAAMETAAAELGVRHATNFLGTRPRSEILDGFATGAWHCAVLTSIDLGWRLCEGIPVCLMEAMAYGVPVIATASGSVDELVSPDAGIIVPVGDHEKVAGAIARLASDATLYQRLSAGARQQIDPGFDVAVNARQFADMLSGKTMNVNGGLHIA